MSSKVEKFDAKWYKRIRKLPINNLIYATTIAGHPVIIAAVLVITSLLLYDNGYDNIAIRVVILLPLLFVVSAIKLIIHRIRPEENFKGRVLIDFYSFPSGHAYASMMLSGTFVYLSAQFLNTGWIILTTLLFGLTTLLVGISRVYIKAHYMSDVIGGWVIALPIVVAVFAI